MVDQDWVLLTLPLQNAGVGSFHLLALQNAVQLWSNSKNRKKKVNFSARPCAIRVVSIGKLIGRAPCCQQQAEVLYPC